ncbi:MAG TPA: sigma-70 family RNA polymerase sigma factor, partial [Nitrospiraceae bacterium]|nr:sigma-70 family RNA polymerase sigma factor [Nitrospiraceae bacterium]
MKQVVASFEGQIAIEEQELQPECGIEHTAFQASGEELQLVTKLRSGDEAAFASLVDRHHNALLRLAMAHVSDRSIAEEVVQETWIGVLEGLDRFEGRSSLKTWIFRILTNKAKTRGVRESRHVSFSPLAADDGSDEPAVDLSKFQTTGHWAGYWASYPRSWDENTPEKLLLSKEGTTFLEQAIEALPPKLRQIIVMRDVEGLSSEEACNILGISETNQRVLLHRGR